MSRLAELLSLDETGVQEFYKRVREARKGFPPTLELVTLCIEKFPATKTSPADVAKIIDDHYDLILQSTRSSKLNTQSLDQKQAPTANQKPKKIRRKRNNLMTTKGIIAGVEIKNKCPHGVLITRKCAICDPEGFQLENG